MFIQPVSGRVTVIPELHFRAVLLTTKLNTVRFVVTSRKIAFGVCCSASVLLSQNPVYSLPQRWVVAVFAWECCPWLPVIYLVPFKPSVFQRSLPCHQEGFVNPLLLEIWESIPVNATNILQVGCGSLLNGSTRISHPHIKSRNQFTQSSILC